MIDKKLIPIPILFIPKTGNKFWGGTEIKEPFLWVNDKKAEINLGQNNLQNKHIESRYSYIEIHEEGQKIEYLSNKDKYSYPFPANN